MFKKTVVAACCLLGVISFSSFGWEAVSKYLPSSWINGNLSGNTSVSINQYEENQFNNGNPSFAAITIRLNNTSSPKTRDLIVLSDLSNSTLRQAADQLYDAYKTGKKIKWFGNDAYVPTTDQNVSWEGYTCTIYKVIPGMRFEFTLE